MTFFVRVFIAGIVLLVAPCAWADDLPVVPDVDGQPLGGNAGRLLKALEFLGSPLPKQSAKALSEAIDAADAAKIQTVLDPYVLLQVGINPEARVKVMRGPAAGVIRQAGYTPVLIKVVNDSPVKAALNMTCPQAGPVYGGSRGIRPAANATRRFLHLEMFRDKPMTRNLSGLKVEYAVILVYSSESGKREATIGFDVGQGTQDLGFRGEAPVLFDVKPGIPVRVRVRDYDGTPTVARLTFRDAAGHVCPPQPKRLAPDLFFQQQVYRPDGGTVLLPPGELTVEYGRGPEYRLTSLKVRVPEHGEAEVSVKLERWINPADWGYYSGDHHIHAAGCSHYTSPTEGVHPPDMFLHVKGEALNVGCCLTWGPCYEYQRTFFETGPNKLTEPFTVLKYDVEVSGFGSQALGHVCLLNLRDQTYPGSDGTKTKGWPTWTTPLMRWAKGQGAVTGYAHSANGLDVNGLEAAKRLLAKHDANGDGRLSAAEAASALLPEPFGSIDGNGDGFLSAGELADSNRRAVGRLPNVAIPEMNGIGAQEICVTTAMRVCDFISAMDTERVPEWNCWYHIMNCGFPLKVSGETDFPCISGSRVGQGRVYVHLGKVDHVDFAKWCDGLAKGRSYISDGYAHAVEFTVDGKSAGDDVPLERGGPVRIKARVAFAAGQPLGTAVGGATPAGPTRKVELVVNGVAVESRDVPADDAVHDLEFTTPIETSSWVAVRHFPSLHTNPVTVTVAGKPIRASRRSAEWCVGVIEQLWKVRAKEIAAGERPEADQTFRKAIDVYRRVAAEAADGT